MKKVVFTAICAALTACASSPDKMTATDVSPLQYRSYSCNQLIQEGSRIHRKVDRLYAQLKTASDRDAWQTGVGIVLFWPALFFLEGGDGPEAVEYRELKGEYDAVQKMVITKNCSMTLPDLDKELKAKAAAARKATQQRSEKNE